MSVFMFMSVFMSYLSLKPPSCILECKFYEQAQCFYFFWLLTNTSAEWVSGHVTPLDCSLPARLFHPWDFLARILQWVAISFSSGFARPRNWTWVSCLTPGVSYKDGLNESTVSGKGLGILWPEMSPRYAETISKPFPKTYSVSPPYTLKSL